MKKAVIIASSIIVFLLLIVIVGFIIDDNRLIVTNYEYSDEKIDDNLDGVKILQISDWHNHSLEFDNTSIITEIVAINPDVILLTGDFIDRPDTSLDTIATLVDTLKNYPTYYVNGNHESTAPLYHDMLDLFHDNGILFLNNENTKLNIGGTKEIIPGGIEVSVGGTNINILGISDPMFASSENYVWRNEAGIEDAMKKVTNNLDSNLSILLSHRPELFDIYASHEVDMVFSGHTHGGQIALPYCRPFFSPNQGLFPYYSRGVYTEGVSTMFLSAGSGEGSLKVRINVPAELLVVTLKKPQA